jgi:hypothetical protein
MQLQCDDIEANIPCTVILVSQILFLPLLVRRHLQQSHCLQHDLQVLPTALHLYLPVAKHLTHFFLLKLVHDCILVVSFCDTSDEHGCQRGVMCRIDGFRQYVGSQEVIDERGAVLVQWWVW